MSGGWMNAHEYSPPENGHGMAVLVQITCDCGKGGQVALPAGRMGGRWILGGSFEHDFHVDYWMRLPEFPPPLALTTHTG